MKGNLWVIATAAFIGVISVNSLGAFFVLFVVLLWLWMGERKLLMLLVCLSCILFFGYTNIVNSFNVTSFKEGPNTISGTISSIPEIDGDFMSFELKTETENLKVNYYISSKQEKNEVEQLEMGNTCYLTGSLEPPSHLRVPSLFDYERYLYYQNIHWIYELKAKPECHQLSNSFFSLVQQSRQTILSTIVSEYPARLHGLAASLLIGERSLLPDEVEEAYQILGLSHVLAVSGLHVGVVGGVFFWLCIRLGLTREKAYASLIAFYPIYMTLTGCAPSVMRASLMAMLIVISLRLKLNVNPLDGVSFACLVILAVNPYYAYHIGFQLSFLIAFALIVSSKSIINRSTHPFAQLLSLSVLPQIISFPVVIYHFHQISFLSLGLNLIYVPIISIIVLPGLMLTFLLHFLNLHFLFQFVSEILAFFIDHIHTFLVFIADKNTIVVFGKISAVTLIVSLGVSIVILLLWERGNVLLGGTMWSVFCIVLYVMPYLNPYGEVSFIDVGQGDSILITLPFQRQVILIDTGGRPMYGNEEEWQKRASSFDIGGDVVLPYIKSKGIRAVDLLILTHGDYDHAGGAKELLEGVSVKRLLLDHSTEQTVLEKELIHIAKEGGTTISLAEAGQSWSESDAQFTIFQALEKAEENDGSVILHARLGGFSWLFTGDLEEEGERRLLSSGYLQEIDVLKVGHHGSPTSSSKEFIEHLSPKLSIISVGVNNRYGHPNAEVLKRYEELHIPVLRTDENGTVRYIFRNNKIGKWSVMLN
ncbi:DNA internalization-related competence protein ComEC/Rec2 [Guptibacillus hwajinpoensis]|uniref:DNA internalization-related competence protein ComEC/Rec2 n=1 Tax=Guptibacillus hwajinpoensis TaxID=208199 RepID=UPI00384F2A89